MEIELYIRCSKPLATICYLYEALDIELRSRPTLVGAPAIQDTFAIIRDDVL